MLHGTSLPVPSTVEAAKSLRVGIFPFEPINYMDKSDQAQGLYPDLLREIAREARWDLEFVPGSWNEGLDRLQNGAIDLIMSVAYSQNRAEIMDFTQESVMDLWGQVYIRPEGIINNISDLTGRRVAVMRKDISGENFKATVRELNVQCNVQEFLTHGDVFKAVKEGVVDAGIAPQYFGLRHYRAYDLVPSTIQFSPFSIYFAVKKGQNFDILTTIDRQLILWKQDKDSIYYQHLSHWLGMQPYSLSVITRWLLWILATIVVVVILLTIMNMILKFQIKRNTRKLLASERYNRMLFEQSLIGLSVARMDGKLVDVNSAYVNTIGRSIDETLNLTCWDITPEKYLLQEQQLLATLSTSGVYGPYEKEFIHKDGYLVPVQQRGLLIELNGEKHILSSIEDITERKLAEKERIELERQLHQSQKIESVGRLAGGVAHDYNNMLSVIIGRAELAQKRAYNPESLHNDLDQILQAAIRSRDITQQLLTFARKQIISPRVLDLNVAVESMLTMLKQLLGENIDLIWQPKEKLWPVEIDPSQIDQILANLCINARDAIADVGKMIIETDWVSLDQAYCHDHAGFIPGDFVMLAVSDNGCGMGKETLDNIFEPFFTTKPTGKGTGLGLSMVYGVVKQHNGFINVYSEPNEGTTFRIYLPRYKGQIAEECQATSGELLKGQGETVLVVEDETSILTLIKEMLSDFGYKVLAANSPSEALDLANTHPVKIQLLITDVVMPEMNGRMLAGRLQSMHPQLKCLYMSGYTADVIAHHGVLDKGIHFIQKPFSRIDFSVHIRTALALNA